MFIEYLRRNPDAVNIILSVFAGLIVFFISNFFKAKARKTRDEFNLDESRYFLIKRIISMFSYIIIASILIFIWGISLKNIWITLSSIAAMVAIAFVAVWSLLGNILAGLILYFTTPFKINDHIELSPDNISGKVIAINAFYTVLLGSDKAYICIPNTFFFQKYIKNYKNKPIA
ncbi:MAG: mechanosensitive ion channel family protein [Candidatus Omnitrophota bacterium]|nr:mechanosensitive ion channel family protein [Candidatus Omnitrophota bacterium]MBU2527853.1 mechanosensitive ion channel family protein [bacterium]MBU3929206.1 mechanosensitive ion channel family protein [bacterium]MBU4123750.1 mechanosensitive ion channel family protein [bacterium]